MTARRRSRRRSRPLAEFAERSWLHAAAVGLLRFALLAALAVVTFVVVMNVLVPQMIDGLVEQFRESTR
jgi:hypothetical protein